MGVTKAESNFDIGVAKGDRELHNFPNFYCNETNCIHKSQVKITGTLQIIET